MMWCRFLGRVRQKSVCTLGDECLLRVYSSGASFMHFFRSTGSSWEERWLCALLWLGNKCAAREGPGHARALRLFCRLVPSASNADVAPRGKWECSSTGWRDGCSGTYPPTHVTPAGARILLLSSSDKMLRTRSC